MRTCPTCSLVNPDSAIVCDCGQVIDADAARSVPGDLLRPPEAPRRQPPRAGLAAKVFVGVCGYVFVYVLFAVICAVLHPVITFPISMPALAGVAGAALAVKLLDGPYAEAGGQVPRREPRRNYLLRHWRGELSLGVSYWLNGWLVSFVVLCASALASAFWPPLDNPYAPILFGVSIWILAAVGEVWYFVGTWRSADRPTPGGWISSWSGLAKVALVIGATALVAMTVGRGWPALRSGLEQARAATRAADGTTANASSGENRQKIARGGRARPRSSPLRSRLDGTPS